MVIQHVLTPDFQGFTVVQQILAAPSLTLATPVRVVKVPPRLDLGAVAAQISSHPSRVSDPRKPADWGLPRILSIYTYIYIYIYIHRGSGEVDRLHDEPQHNIYQYTYKYMYLYLNIYIYIYIYIYTCRFWRGMERYAEVCRLHDEPQHNISVHI